MQKSIFETPIIFQSTTDCDSLESKLSLATLKSDATDDGQDRRVEQYPRIKGLAK